MVDVKDFDPVATNNNSAAPNGAPEGWAPSQVNDVQREVMAALARWYKDISAVHTTTGAADDYVITTDQTFSAYTAGMVFGFVAHQTNTGTSTFTVSGLASKTIVNPDGSVLDAGEITVNRSYIVIYQASDDNFVIVNPSVNFSAPPSDFDSGDRVIAVQSTAPTGWTKVTDAAFDNAALRLFTGTPSNGGSVGFSTVFVNNRTTSAAGSHNHGGSVGGHALTTAEMPSHDHNVRYAGHWSTNAPGNLGGTSASTSNTTSTQNAGGNQPHTHGISLSGSHSHVTDLAVKYVGAITVEKD